MSEPHAARRQRGRGLRFSLFGIPVRIGISVVVVLGFIGWNLGDWRHIALFVVVGLVSVLVHELGHAVAARFVGHRPSISLAGLGGVTTYEGETSRWQQLGITFAGPLVQIVGGIVGLQFVEGFGVSPAAPLPEFAVQVWVVVSILWGVLNLVPILPLDGGQLLRDLLPFAPATRTRAALVVSVVLAAAALLWALTSGDVWIALLAGLLGWTNLQQLLATGPGRTPPPRPEPPAADLLDRGEELLSAGDARGWRFVRAATTAPGPVAVRSVAASRIVDALVRTGRAREAYLAAADTRHDLVLDEAVMARALAGHPNAVGVRRAVLAWAHARPNDARTRGIAAGVLALGGNHERAAEWVESGPVPASITELVRDARERMPR